MRELHIIDQQPPRDLPDLTTPFARELEDISGKVKEIKKEQFDGKIDLPDIMIKYAIIMIFEYQEKGDGTVPHKIVDNIWEQIGRASKQNFIECQEDAFMSDITNTFYKKLQEPEAVNETLNYWEYYNL